MTQTMFELYAMDPDAIRGMVRIDQETATDGSAMRLRVSNNNRAWNLEAFGRDVQDALRTAAANDQEVTIRLEPAAPGKYRCVSTVEDAGPNSIRAEHEALVALLGVTPSRFIPLP